MNKLHLKLLLECLPEELLIIKKLFLPSIISG
jgi:hypothetical protein